VFWLFSERSALQREDLLGTPVGKGSLRFKRGPQKDILLPGTYYINPFLFKVIPETAKEIRPGEVAVVVSNVGKDPSEEVRREMADKVRQRMEREELEQAEESAARLDAIDDTRTVEQIKQDLMTGDPADRRLDEGAHEAYVVPEGYRGIQETVVGPGRYYVNTLAITPIVIPTTNQTVEWTAGEVANTFNPFEVISKDGFTMQLEVRVVFRVKPEDAPFMVAKIGGIERLIQNGDASADRFDLPQPGIGIVGDGVPAKQA